jgi:polysaccharide export outer membrane protein
MGRILGVWRESLYILLLTGSTACLFLGCESRFKCEASLPEGPPDEQRVTLEAGDVVEVRFFYTPELNVSQAVRPDGKIALQLIGDVPVRGKSPEDVRQELLTLYQPHLKEPDVAVIVQSFLHRRVFVGGQVLRPGVIQMPRPMTALDAIMESGGFQLPQAEVGNVIIVRHENDQRYGYCIDLKPALRGGQVRPFYLEPEDIVYVPRTRITEIGQWVDQHINNLLPKTGLVVLSTSGNTTIGYDLR